MCGMGQSGESLMDQVPRFATEAVLVQNFLNKMNIHLMAIKVGLRKIC